MSCSRTKRGDPCKDRAPSLLLQSLTLLPLDHCALLLKISEKNLHDEGPTTFRKNIMSDLRLTERNSTNNEFPNSMMDNLKSHFVQFGLPHSEPLN